MQETGGRGRDWRVWGAVCDWRGVGRSGERPGVRQEPADVGSVSLGGG